MERILLGMNAQHAHWDALDRAVSLAERMDAKVYVLVVLADENTSQAFQDREMERSVRRRVELLQRNNPRSRHVELFIAKGDYQEEVIRFAKQYNITLFLIEKMDASSQGSRGIEDIEAIRHRLRCRVELITHKRH